MLGHLVSNSSRPDIHSPLPNWLKRLIAYFFRRR